MSNGEPDPLAFLTGVSGVIYPVAFLQILRQAGDAFRETCPKADDVWINYHAAKAGFPVRQASDKPQRFADVPGTQETALWRSNVDGGNDRQILRTYDPETLSRLRALH